MKRIVYVLICLSLTSSLWSKETDQQSNFDSVEIGALIGATAGAAATGLIHRFVYPVSSLTALLGLSALGGSGGAGIGELIRIVKTGQLGEGDSEVLAKFLGTSAGTLAGLKFVSSIPNASILGASSAVAASGLIGLGAGTLLYRAFDEYILDSIEAVHNIGRSLSKSVQKKLKSNPTEYERDALSLIL